MTGLLRLDQVTAGYGGSAAIVDVGLEVGAGEVVALVGANGAGKTTTLLATSGLVDLLAGSIEVFGRPAALRRAREGLAHVPEDRGLFPGLTVHEHLRLGAPRRADPGLRAQVLEWFPALDALMDRRAGLLSGGEQQMLALARALVGRPKLLLVDELSLGLAPIVVQAMLPRLREVAAETGAGVLVVEQHVGLVLEVADRAAVLARGRIAFTGTAADLRSRPELLEGSYLGDA